MSKRDDNAPGPQPMPPEMWPQTQVRPLLRQGDPDLDRTVDGLGILRAMLRQCLRNQWLLLQVTTYGTPSVALDAVEAALSATEDLLGGKP